MSKKIKLSKNTWRNSGWQEAKPEPPPIRISKIRVK